MVRQIIIQRLADVYYELGRGGVRLMILSLLMRTQNKVTCGSDSLLKSKRRPETRRCASHLLYQLDFEVEKRVDLKWVEIIILKISHEN